MMLFSYDKFVRPLTVLLAVVALYEGQTVTSDVHGNIHINTSTPNGGSLIINGVDIMAKIESLKKTTTTTTTIPTTQTSTNAESTMFCLVTGTDKPLCLKDINSEWVAGAVAQHTGVYNSACVVYEGHLFIVSGFQPHNHGGVMKLTSGKWQYVTDGPVWYDHAAAVYQPPGALKAYIYAIGGYTATLDAPQVFIPVSNRVRYLDLSGSEGTWVPAPSMKVERRLLSAVVYQGKLWALGGENSACEDTWEASMPLSSTEYFDGQWHDGPEMVEGISRASASVYQGRLFVLAGITGTMQIFDGKTWKFGPRGKSEEAFTRHNAGIGIVSGRLCLSGGTTFVGQPAHQQRPQCVKTCKQCSQEDLSTTFCFDGETWVEGTKLNYAIPLTSGVTIPEGTEL